MTQIEVIPSRSQPILFRRGVMQGSPLSRALYNLTTDHILHELTEETIASTYGVSLTPSLK